MNLATLKSLSFLILVLTNVGLWLTTVGATVKPEDAYIYTAFSTAAYAISRGLAKVNVDGKPWWKTTEVYVVVAGGAITLVGGFQGHISPLLMTGLVATLTAAISIAEGLRTPPPAA